jgi:hypothetical protein
METQQPMNVKKNSTRQILRRPPLKSSTAQARHWKKSARKSLVEFVYDAILNTPDKRAKNARRNKKPLLTSRLRNAHTNNNCSKKRAHVKEGNGEGKIHLWGHNLRVLAFAKSLDTSTTNDLYMQQKLAWKAWAATHALSPILFVKTSPLPQRPYS